MQPFFALVTPVGNGGSPSHPIAPGGPPPGYWGGAPLPTPTPPIYYPPGVNVPVFPTHPIAPGGPPAVVSPPIFYPPFPSTGPGFPTNPIAPGGPPPGYWGGAPLPTPTPPIYLPPGVNVPVFPTNPIAPGGPPPGYWGGVAPPQVGNPISGGGYIVGWSPVYGYVVIPLGGAQPIAPGGEGGVPTHPIAPGGEPEPK
jgi:hypothetical protein